MTIPTTQAKKLTHGPFETINKRLFKLQVERLFSAAIKASSPNSHNRCEARKMTTVDQAILIEQLLRRVGKERRGTLNNFS